VLLVWRKGDANQMNGKLLYQLFCHERETEGLTCPTWDALAPREQIAWGKLARRLCQCYGTLEAPLW